MRIQDIVQDALQTGALNGWQERCIHLLLQTRHFTSTDLRALEALGHGILNGQIQETYRTKTSH